MAGFGREIPGTKRAYPGSETATRGSVAMNNASYIGLSLQVALKRELDIIANNVANANTTGYQAEDPLFEEYLARLDRMEDVSFVQDRATLNDTSPGPLQSTGNPLDVAMIGAGYFVVETPEGFRYTRAGAFQLNAEGQIVTPSGAAVMGEGNAPIFIAPGETSIAIARDGTISTENGAVGRLAVVRFEHPEILQKVGDTLYEATETPTAVEIPQVAQGTIEASNVRPVVELTRLIEVSRTYQQVQQMIDAEAEIAKKALTALAGQV
jgi:flagellar basal-body rod protein FlgF